MTPETTSAVLAYFTAAWPWIDPGESTALVWHEALQRFPDDVAVVAMKALVSSEDRPPSIRRFTDECQKVLRARNAKRPQVEGGELARPESSQMARALAAGMRVAARDIPKHQFHSRKDGASKCPACSTRGQRTHVPGEIVDAIRDHLSGGDGG